MAETKTIKAIRQRVTYCHDTGKFTWRTQRKSRDVIGTVAGNICRAGYVVVHIDGVTYLAHRLAWAYVNKFFAPETIDHINGIRTDNRLENLRLASKAQQSQNRIIRSDSMSGVKGCRWDAKSKAWLVRIGVNGKRTSVGRYKSISEAARAYNAAATLLFGEFAKLNGDGNEALLDDNVRRAVQRLRGDGGAPAFD